jgi:hypothetical protein
MIFTTTPRPALLLGTTGFVLATEDAAYLLQVTPVKAESASLAEMPDWAATLRFASIPECDATIQLFKESTAELGL